MKRCLLFAMTTLLSLTSLNAAPRDYKENLGTPLVNNARAVDEDWTLTPPNDNVVANRKKLLEILPDGVDKILFVKRNSYTANHYYTEYVNSRFNPGGNLCLLDLKTGKVTEICPEKMSQGQFGRIDLSFDGKKILFGYKGQASEGYRIHEIGIDGSGLRQVLNPPECEAQTQKKYNLQPGYHHGTDDMHPCYLPDGGIAFVSTRCQYGILCNTPDDFSTTLLYRMNADGTGIKALSNGSVSEQAPSVTPDGRIIYSRWEYVDKGAVSVKCIWSMRPDGTGTAEIYGNDVALPPTMNYARAIPGSPNKYVILGCPHYPQGNYGTIIRLDMKENIRSVKPMTYMTPYVDVRGEGGWHFRDSATASWKGDRSGKGDLFTDPYPINDKWFLVAHKPAGAGDSRTANGYGLYLLGENGERFLIYRDKGISAFVPFVVQSRPTPPVPRSIINEKLAEKGQAACMVTDVYHGMEDTPRGSIKYLRVLEQVPRTWKARRFWGGDAHDQQHAAITDRTHLGLKVQHGIVPVEKDGSAYFIVPSDKNIFFQALDENYLSVQTERTFVNYAAGEVRACIGCHETPDDGPANMSPQLLALRRAPSTPGPQPGEKTGKRPLHYPTDVQPVLDKYCIECHKPNAKDTWLDLTGTETKIFSKSYENLLSEKQGGALMPKIGENHPKTGNVHYLPTRSLGSHASILGAIVTGGKTNPDRCSPNHQKRIKELVEKHKEVKVPLEDAIRITNWIDTNGQFYGSWYGRRNIQYKNHPNYRPVPTWDSAIGIPPLPEDKR